jgi:hypothetical protein
MRNLVYIVPAAVLLVGRANAAHDREPLRERKALAASIRAGLGM